MGCPATEEGAPRPSVLEGRKVSREGRREEMGRIGWLVSAGAVPAGPCLTQGWFWSCLACAPFFLAVPRRGGAQHPQGSAQQANVGASLAPRLQKVKPRPRWLDIGSRGQQRLGLRTRVSWQDSSQNSVLPPPPAAAPTCRPCPVSSLWIKEQGVPRLKAGHRLMPQKGLWEGLQVPALDCWELIYSHSVRCNKS